MPGPRPALSALPSPTASRAEIINRALRRELRRRAARRDAEIYTRTEDPDLGGRDWTEVTRRQTAAAWADLD